MATSMITLSTVDTDITTGVKEAFYLPVNYSIKDIYITAYEAPTSGDIEIEVAVDSNVVSDARFIIKEGNRNSKEHNSPAIPYTVWSKGQWVTIDVKVGTTGKGVKVYIEYEIL